MKLYDLLYKVNIVKVFGPTDIEIVDICYDSRKVKMNGLFIAIKGVESDGHNYISECIEKGVLAIIVEDLPDYIDKNITYIKVENSNKALAILSSNFYDNPSRKIKLIGVTGTNGKTTIVNLLHQLFTLFGLKVGLLSTIENKIIKSVFISTHTTPSSLEINSMLVKMVELGCEYCFMEVSSHAIKQHRVYGLHFDGGVFTNLSHDHLDYHKTFSEYRDVKKSFFDSLSVNSFVVVNKDDKNGFKMIEGTKSKVLTYSLRSNAHYNCKVIESQFEGMLLQINTIDVWVKLIGKFNAYNLLAVYAVAEYFGFNKYEILKGLSLLDAASGRFQCIRNQDKTIGIVDYAHTSDALKNVLTTINAIRDKSNQLVTVVGCGGDRDISKRSLMGQIACEYSTHVILTSDNPRSEDPDEIINHMQQDLNPLEKSRVLVIVDRKQAIKAAAKLVKIGGVILIAGKGHEKYQEIKGEKIPFDDMKELKYSLNIIKK